MKIYEREIFDNLSHAIASNSSIAMVCDILPYKDTNENLLQYNQQRAIASLDETKRQEDLYYLNSVLVSTGWNKNDDVFSKANLWNARDTPINKPFNFMHDENDIIGHMTGSIVLDQNGNMISISPDQEDDLDNLLPDYFDIFTSAVIYKSWADKSQRERINQLIEEINDNQWSVSMECHFNDFDYAIIDKDGSTRALARNEESSFLTKHLRCYGGEGDYNGYKIGRLLKGFYFTGKGLVNRPANPRSAILSKDVNPFSNANSNNFLTAMEVSEMTQAIDEQANQYQKDLEAAKLEVETVKAEMLKAQEDAQKTSAEHESAIVQKDQVIAAHEAKIKELTDAISAAMKEKEKTEEEMKSMKKDMKFMKRKDKLSKAGADETTVEELLAKFDEVSDEVFENVVALVSLKPAPVAPQREEKVSTEALDNVQITEPTVVATEEDENVSSKAIAHAVEWLQDSVLKTTRKNKR